MSEESGGEELNTIGTMWQELVVLVFIVISALALALIISRSLTSDITASQETQRFITAESVRHCFLYEDSARVHYDMIDLNKFNDKTISNCLGDRKAIATLRKGDEVLATVNTPGGSFNRIYGFNINVYGKEGNHRLIVGLTQ